VVFSSLAGTPAAFQAPSRECLSVGVEIYTGRSLAKLGDQRRVNVTAQMTIIASMQIGIRKPVIVSSHQLRFSSHHLQL
jgi:hypothetical protein